MVYFLFVFVNELLQVVTQFLKLEILLDDNVKQRIELQIERGGVSLSVNLLVRVRLGPFFFPLVHCSFLVACASSAACSISFSHSDSCFLLIYGMSVVYFCMNNDGSSRVLYFSCNFFSGWTRNMSTSDDTYSFLDG